MPRPRTTVTDANGRYSLAQLLPGSYRVTFEASNGAKHTLTATVLLDQATVLSLELDTASDAIEELVVVGKRVAHRGQASIANAISGEALGSVPLGPNYRDLVRLAPGVQVTQDRVRGPSARAAAGRTTSIASMASTCPCRCSARCRPSRRATTSISSPSHGAVPRRWGSIGAADSPWTPPRSPAAIPSTPASSTPWSPGVWWPTGEAYRARSLDRTPTGSALS